MSPSVSQRSPMGRHESRESASPVRAHPSSRRRTPPRREGSPVGSPRRKRSIARDISPRHKTSRNDSLPVNDKYASRGRSPRQAKPKSQISRSPSPSNKRLRRDQAEREVEAARERENGRRHGKSRERPTSSVSTSPPARDRHLKRFDADRETRKAAEWENERYHKEGNDEMRYRERVHDKGIPKDKRDRSDLRSERDAVDENSSRSRPGQSDSLTNHRHCSHHRSRSPSASNSRARGEGTNSRGNSHGREDGDDSLAKMKAAQDALEEKQKQKPSFELSGKLAAETNRVRGVTLLFTEPPDARKPDVRWRLYVFKGGEVLNDGDSRVPVMSKNALEHKRLRNFSLIVTIGLGNSNVVHVKVEKERPDGTMSKQVRPYLMDLGSTNKTFLNDNPVEPQRYYELFEKDTIKFGNSSSGVIKKDYCRAHFSFARRGGSFARSEHIRQAIRLWYAADLLIQLKVKLCFLRSSPSNVESIAHSKFLKHPIDIS
ncbi:FHA domain-containing protein [Drosera capensis]